MTCRLLPRHALKKSAVRADRVVTTVAVHALVRTDRHPVAQLPVVPLAPMWHLQMAVTNPLRPLALTLPNPPLSAFAKSPRQLQQLTVKENNYVATCSPEIPQRAKGP